MSDSVGVNRFTGKPLTDFDHVRQSVGVIFTTRIGERVYRRTFGGALVGLLGKPLTPENLMRAYMALVIGLELWEPRFRVRSLAYPGTTASGMAQGKLGIEILGDYMPNALEGDFTVASSQLVVI